MEMKFIEGLPCAGKSSLIRLLGSNGYSITHELGRVLPKSSFPGNGKTIEEILKIDDWFIEKESSRCLETTEFYDRSYFSHLTYAYAYSRVMGLSSFEKTIGKYQKAINSNKLTLPSEITYINIDPETSIERQKIRVQNGSNSLDSIWQDRSFLRDLIWAYTSLFSCLEGIDVTEIDGRMSTEDKLEILSKKRKKKEVEIPKINLERYIEIT